MISRTRLSADEDEVVGAVLHRREALAALIADLSLARPLAFAAALNALVEAAGELPDAQWRQRWEHPPAAATGRVGRAVVIPPEAPAGGA